jgi:hypothetical protein
LAANDPAGSWKVVIRELLNNTESEAAFTYTPPPRARSLAGVTSRAVYAANDCDNAFRFARLHHDVTIVKGASDFNNAATDRLIRVLEPWGVRCKVMPLAEAAKSRWLREDEAATWCGLVYAGRGQIKPGDGNPPSLAGFAVQGPVILLGNPDDNAIIKFLLQEQFLPYRPDKDKFPGAGRGMLAWQRDGIGPGQESITLIAYDEAGMQEAVGTLYEAVAGLEPLTRWSWPSSDAIAPATTATPVPTGQVEELARLPDRIVGLKLDGGQLTALSHDGTQLVGPPAAFYVEGKSSVVDGNYAERASQLATPPNPADIAAAQKLSDSTRLVKFVVPHGEQTAVAYWGGTLDVRDKQGKTVSRTRLPQDVTALVSDGKSLFAGLADGRILRASFPP